MAVKIKLKRIGKMREPHYRIVVADARTKRSGRAIEEIGQYHPRENPSRISVDSERAQYWLGVGAQPTEAVAAIFRVTGDWQAFKGEPAPPAMLVAEPKADKRSIFEAAAKEAAGLSEKAATTPKAKKAPAKKAAAAPAEAKDDAATAKDDATPAKDDATPAKDDAVKVEAPAAADASDESTASEAPSTEA
ncbi:MAG TPA: 30S ribosomal protein S16 [Actinomycetes bacterium]|nr:30S ribosomal protein S16 [Actinomycetes bacterium]